MLNVSLHKMGGDDVHKQKKYLSFYESLTFIRDIIHKTTYNWEF